MPNPFAAKRDHETTRRSFGGVGVLASGSMRDFGVIGMITWTGLTALASCGPSLRVEEQSAAYFEHCHAAERDPRATVEDRIACWETWLAHWAEGGPKARGTYAKERVIELLHGVNRTAGGSTPDEPTELTALHRVPQTPARVPSSRHHGSGGCDDICLPGFRSCLDRCPPASIKACRTACESERRVCQLACP